MVLAYFLFAKSLKVVNLAVGIIIIGIVGLNIKGEA